MWSLPTAQRAIIAGGAMGMAFTQLTTSPATVQFARDLGGSEFHVGILGALPVALISMQLVAALMVPARMARKPVWFWVTIVQRVVFLPAALGPWLWPEMGDAFWIWTLLALSALNQGLAHFGTPLWLSWMGDYLPHCGLSCFWGRRQFAQQWAAALALLANTCIFFHSGADVRGAFAIIISIGCVLGVMDILLFIRIPEPPAAKTEPLGWQEVLAAPFRQADFRSFITFCCCWHVAAMVGAPFISMYLLKHVGMDMFHVLLLWSVSWVGGAVFSSRLGEWTERFGQRPMLVICVAFKSLNMIALVLCPADPQRAFWMLLPVFMIDAILNAGVTIATNSFLLKHSPAQNRTMFIAAGTAFAGMAGGLTSIAAGTLLSLSNGWRWSWHGIELVNFEVLFAVSVVLRLSVIALAIRIREPESHGVRGAVRELSEEARMALGWRRGSQVHDEARPTMVASGSAAIKLPVDSPPSSAGRQAA